MPPAKKKAVAPMAGNGKGKAALAKVGYGLLDRLSDPKVQDELVEQGRRVADLVQAWWKERKPQASDDPSDPSSGKAGPLHGRFGQRKLERRVENLQASIAEAAQRRPDLAQALVALSATLEEISLALRIAGGLPLAKRKRAHLKIDEELDKLERTVFDAAMPRAD